MHIPPSATIPKPLSTQIFVESQGERRFYPVSNDENSDKLGVISEIFHRILTPLYGSQDKAIEQIRASEDRRCFLLYEGETPVAVLVFKTVLSKEFAELGVDNSIEIKSLFVDHSANNSGKGLGSALIEKLIHEVEQMQIGNEAIHVTVSETKQESLNFFRKKGFEVKHTWDGRYIRGIKEYLLALPTRIMTRASSEYEVVARKNLGKRNIYQLSFTVTNAHQDDVHVLLKLADNTFVSGSKDGSLYKWSREGELLYVIDEPEPTTCKDPNWITAAAVINNKYWVSGERNGKTFLWKTSGEYVREIKMKVPPLEGHYSQLMNRRRVNCLTPGLDPNVPSFFVGFPTVFDEYNLIEGKTESYNKVHGNDWVYCMQMVDPDRMLAVCGPTIEMFNRGGGGWLRSENVIPEEKRFQDENRKWQRPFISSLTPLQAQTNHYAFTVFSGEVKVFNASTKQIVNTWHEHVGRVWTSESIAPHILASCGDDRTVKIWDTRQAKSVVSIDGHIGPVTSLLSFDPNNLIAGTCSKNPTSIGKGAEIKFYDLRM